MKKRLVAVMICILVTFFLVSSAKGAESLTIYVDDGNADYLAELQVTGEKDADTLISLLVEYKMLPEGTKVNSFEEMHENQKTVGKLDLSKEYLEAVTSTGTAGETMYIYSVVNTMIKNLGLDEVALTANGETISTGHAIYDWNLTFYDHIIAAADWDGNTITSSSIGSDRMQQEASSDESSQNGENSIAEQLETEESSNQESIVESINGTKEEATSEINNGNLSESKMTSESQEAGEVASSDRIQIVEEQNTEELNHDTQDGSLVNTVWCSISDSIQKLNSRKVVLFIGAGAIICLFIGTYLSVVKKKKL